jgi:RimJ/RimL family protein N-acetyltransferase
MKYILKTERLKLRELTLEDTAFIIELLNSPGWLQFIGDRNVKTEQQAISYLQNGPMKSYEQNGFGLYLVEKKNGDTPIGMCGILQRNELDIPDIGFALLPSFNGHGYAYEIAKATMDYAIDTLKIEQIGAIVVLDNQRSIHLLQKLGLTFVKNIWFSEEELMFFSN